MYETQTSILSMPRLNHYLRQYAPNEKVIYFYKIKRRRILIKIGIARIIRGKTIEECIWDRIKKTPNVHPKGVHDTIKIIGALVGTEADEKEILDLFEEFNHILLNLTTGNNLKEFFHNNISSMRALCIIISSRDILLNKHDNRCYFWNKLRHGLLSQSHLY